MSGKKVTPHQMRKGLTYVQQGPDFMRMLTGQSSTSNSANNDPRNPYRKPIGIEAKFQTEDASDDDDETAHDILNEREEERPTVVVLKDGKHLDERQVRNILKDLPPGLSEAEIQKKLAEETEKLNQDGSNAKQDDDDDEEEDQDPVDENGKILFRRPKGSTKTSSSTTASSNKSSSNGGKKESTTSASSVKGFEESLFGEAQTKANALKRKSGTSSTTSSASASTSTSKGSADSISVDKKGDGKKKKPKTSKTTTSLLSFGDEE
ncbi:hypothetical protein EDD21DRAFT_386763 [Dissophora ornata]|nr:hypothetical protein BGZ58_003110 [Dissophora ornata]KAI8596958.1 hypothetical protein EDD21DRAFT_386763 [Dissophora ornata]